MFHVGNIPSPPMGRGPAYTGVPAFNPSFRSSVRSKPPTNYLPPDRPGTHYYSVFRRLPNGALDMEHVANEIVSAVRTFSAAASVGVLTPMQACLVSVVSPQMVTAESLAALIMARVTPTEVLMLRSIVAAKLGEIVNYNAGRGGGSVPGRSVTFGGSPT